MPFSHHSPSTTEAHLADLQSVSQPWPEIFPGVAKGGSANDTIRDATVLAVLNSAETANVKAIVVFTVTGGFGRLISKGACRV